MSFSETAPRHGIFSGCCFYVQVCNRSSLAVAEDVRFLRVSDLPDLRIQSVAYDRCVVARFFTIR